MTQPLPPQPPPPPSETDALRAAVGDMKSYAASMAASAGRMEASVTTMTAQVAAAVTAVKTLGTKLESVEAKTDQNTGELQALQLSRGSRVPVIEGATPAVAPMSVSLVVPPIEAAVSASIHAIQKTVEAQPSKVENRWITVGLAVVVVIAQTIIHYLAPGVAH